MWFVERVSLFCLGVMLTVIISAAPGFRRGRVSVEQAGNTMNFTYNGDFIGAAPESRDVDPQLWVDEVVTYQPSVDEEVAPETRNPYWEHYDRVRAEGLLEAAEWKKRDHLAGHPKKAVIDSVCGRIKNSDELQMCCKRGADIANKLLKRYWKLTSLDAKIKHAAREKDGNTRDVRITVSHGKLLSWHFIGREMTAHPEHSSFALARIMQLLRLGRLQQNKTVDFFVYHWDICPNWQTKPAEMSYPTVFWATRPHCEQEITLSYCHLSQVAGFRHDNFLPYDQLIPKVVFRGTAWNGHRIWAAAVNHAFSWMNNMATTTSWVPVVNMCQKALKTLADYNFKELQGTGIPNQDQCTVNSSQAVWGTELTLAEQYSYKYLLNIDGMSALYRLQGNMEAPGVVMLCNSTNSHMSYTRDLIPMVTHIPIRTSLHTLIPELNESYHWAEAHPDIVKDIATESTRWARVHASDRAFSRQWELYHALLADLRVDNATDRFVDGPFGDIKKYQHNSVDCSDRISFFKVQPFSRLVKKKAIHADRVWHIACEEMLTFENEGY
ncbi:hypothetical protein DIPPA_62099 [Diplonema papillatum]|nr:hypothetical protein DIPPA_62099 [Diplonema papillatum]